jgi:hypothetical protein
MAAWRPEQDVLLSTCPWLRCRLDWEFVFHGTSYILSYKYKSSTCQLFLNGFPLWESKSTSIRARLGSSKPVAPGAVTVLEKGLGVAHTSQIGMLLISSPPPAHVAASAGMEQGRSRKKKKKFWQQITRVSCRPGLEWICGNDGGET